MRVLLFTILFLLPALAQAEVPGMIKKCKTCHGKNLTGKKKSPTLVGLTYDELLASLTTDVPKKMKRISNKLNDQEKEKISEYIYTTLKDTVVDEAR